MELDIQYDTTIGGIRVVRADMGPFGAVFTCNTNLGHCTARFDGKLPLSPDLQYANGKLCLSYPPTAIPPGCEDKFEESWSAAREFIRGCEETIAAIISAVENGDPVPVPACREE